jgi:ATP-binding cassette subfamily B protein
MSLRANARYVWNCWRPHRGYLVFLALFTLVSSAVAVAYPLVLKVVIDGVHQALASHTEPHMGKLFLVLGLVMLGRVVAGYYPAFRGFMNRKIETDIRTEAFERILEKDYRFQRTFRTGDVVTRLTDDVGEYPKIAWFCCSGIFRAVDSAAKVVLSLTAMLFLDARLAALSVLPLPVMLHVFYLVQRRLRDRYERQQAAISRTNDLLEATFSGIKIVKAFSAEAGTSRKLAETLDGRIEDQLGVARLQALIQMVDALATRAGQIVALALGGIMVARGRIELGTLYAFYVYLDMLVHPLQDLPMLLVSARQAFVSVERIEEMRAFPAEPASSRGGPPALRGAACGRAEAPPGRLEEIALRNVCFRYDGAAREALAGVDLSVRRGERVAIVGAVASGKSTLLKVLAGLLPPEGGAVFANGRPVEGAAAWRALRARMGYVPQESHLFSETIRENVALGLAGVAALPAPEAAIEKALEIAQLRDDLARFERGAETVLGEKGSLISGGQRQRVAIARALVRRPDLLLLDDSTASLDAQSEERFWSSLDAAMPGVTTVVTTHRLATVRRADRVVLLAHGRVQDAGPHDELLARCAAYRELLAAEARAESLGAPT